MYGAGDVRAEDVPDARICRDGLQTSCLHGGFWGGTDLDGGQGYDTTKLHRLEENVAAADVELTADDLEEIENAQLAAQGHRYQPAQQAMIDR